ncbi:hypothetical protein IFM89_031247 [Coptis chinensis]|uniref:Uncharacterized protein n=1 Tax=Coptis chinensis TaxID=261450 RepID=A0A835IRV7_9MAGN|nr:hypothetical protein IFM89_031247 [Coptis chinensis]
MESWFNFLFQRHINEENVLNEISIEKDVDGFHPRTLANLAGEEKPRWEAVEGVFSECVLRLCRPPRAWGKEWIAMRVEEGERHRRGLWSLRFAKMVKEQLGPSDAVVCTHADAIFGVDQALEGHLHPSQQR